MCRPLRQKDFVLRQRKRPHRRLTLSGSLVSCKDHCRRSARSIGENEVASRSRASANVATILVPREAIGEFAKNIGRLVQPHIGQQFRRLGRAFQPDGLPDHGRDEIGFGAQSSGQSAGGGFR